MSLFVPKLLLVTSALLNLGLAIYAFRKNEQHSTTTFGLLALSISWWALCYLMFVVTPSVEVRYFFNRIKYIGALAIPVLWVIFAMQYTRQETQWLTPRNIVLLAFPEMIFLLIVLSDGWTHFWWPQINLGDGLIPQHTHGNVYYLQLGVTYFYLLWGGNIYRKAYLQSGALYRSQILLFLLGAFIPVVGNVFAQLPVWPSSIDLAPFLFSITTLIFAYAIFRYHLLDLIPIARQTLLEQIPESIIVLDDSNTILDVNQSAAHLLQSTPEALSGKNLLEYTPLSMLRSALQDILAQPPEKHITEEIHLSDQEIYLLKGTPLRYRGAPVGRILVLQNITEQVNARKQVEMLYEQAEKERQRMQATLQNAGEGILLLDADGNMVSRNPIARSLLPYTHAGQFPEALKNAWKDVQESGSAIKIELSIGQQTFHASIAPVPDFGAVITLHDITPLTELMRLNNELISIISHDLRGPLSSISGYAQMARMDNLSRKEYAQIFERIDANARRLANFVSDVLTISRLESGIKPDPSPNPVMMDKIAQYIAEDLEGMARAKGLLMRINVQPHPPFYGDTRLLEQMWRNLIDNAIKYTSAGFVSVSVRTENGVLIAQVADTGRGIPAESLPHIFDKFYRLEREGGKGIGLGLSLVKNIVERHGGSISVESIPNKGSTFTMRFPLPSAAN